MGAVLYDAVLLASDELMRKQTGRKAFIVLSDGADMGSKVSLAEAKQPIEQIYTRIEEELRNQYSLGYTPDRTNPAPGSHHIHLSPLRRISSAAPRTDR